ncbi:MFS transporter [Novosphingobium sp. H3SJ31-1]|uniref:MFS transporter n=1 Tax=Novosphingobium album (ex Liu et al. 2023) TaxID=3031130 RepID=A0ABT5WMP6_9SPHN|nr:MFS transporter [Novosphingobium album (ex Liu et al. 2023)]
MRKKQRRALAAAGMGTVVEFFDYASYSYLATTIASVFFPQADKTAALIQTFAIFALSFAMRPIGGLFWGHYGDRIGRRKSLILTIAGMGMATLAIGILPGYATIGIGAPLLLVIIRLLQSFFTAGQYSGAAVLVGEFAPPRKRGRYVSVVPLGSATGFMLASALTSWLHGALGVDDMLAWGWRLPFLVGGILTLIALGIRQSLEETPDFAQLQEAHAVSEAPIKTLMARHWRVIVALLMVISVNHAGYYIILSYMATYFEVQMDMPSAQAGAITTIALIAYLPLLYVFSAASDRFGRRPILLAGSVLLLLFSYPLFLALPHGGFAVALVVQLLMATFLALNDSTFGAFFIEAFPTDIRYSGFALPFNIGAALFGGASPLFAEWLIGLTGNELVPAFIMMGVAALSLPALLTSRETAPRLVHPARAG